MDLDGAEQNLRLDTEEFVGMGRSYNSSFNILPRAPVIGLNILME